MNRSSPPAGPSPRTRSVVGEDHAALALREATVLMAPVARWLLRNGVSYGSFADLLKTVFVDAARAELASQGTPPTFSALSVLSGVHRKDVRALEAAAQSDAGPAVTPRGVPVASQVFTRWMTNRRYRTRDGRPRSLPRAGDGISFESLAREISRDVHPRTVLDELLRLDLVRLDGDVVVPLSVSFTPSRKLDELTALFAANVSDHIAAAVHNLTVGAPPKLEQSVFADGLSAESVDHLMAQARIAWQAAFETMVREATHRVEADARLEEADQHRMRFGVYFYSEPQAQDAPPHARSHAKPAAPRARSTRRKP